MEKKQTKSVKVKSETNQVEITNIVDYTDILNKIFYSMIAIVVALLLVFTAIMVKGTNNNNTTSNNETEETENTEYDVSMFESLDTTSAIDKIKQGDTQVVYIGRATCGYCVKFLPVLQQAQEDYNYKTIYLDLEKMTSDDQESLTALDNEDSYISENFGYTPMVLVFKDGKLLDGWVGYSEYDSFASFLEDSGLKK